MSPESLPTAKFRPGRIVATANARSQLAEEDILAGIRRHQSGDWGEVHPDDWKANERALEKGARLLSVYRSASNIRFYIITEADRSSTTVLLPEDY
ncbi:MAG TPA: hypothetical protein VN873_03210 [Candidatus Angelobacter sp.]|nr:hypothetical protein [Candidatus Angelobacter sp.]